MYGCSGVFRLDLRKDIFLFIWWRWGQFTAAAASARCSRAVKSNKASPCSTLFVLTGSLIERHFQPLDYHDRIDESYMSIKKIMMILMMTDYTKITNFLNKINERFFYHSFQKVSMWPESRKKVKHLTANVYQLLRPISQYCCMMVSRWHGGKPKNGFITKYRKGRPLCMDIWRERVVVRAKCCQK